MQKHPLGAFVLFEEAKEASLNNVQQLKAEIAAVATDMEIDSRKNDGIIELDYYIGRLRQLSAV
jgi:hypothetical protein